MDKSLIIPGSEIFGSCGTLVGTVDGLDGDFIQLTPAGATDGRPRYLPASVIADIGDTRLVAVVNHTAVVSLLQDGPEPGEAGGNFMTSS